MSNCKPAQTPADTQLDLGISTSDDPTKIEELSKIPYQNAVGALLYVCKCTRPDLAYIVNTLSRFNSNYDFSHWIALKRVKRYLQGTKEYKLTYSAN